MEKEKFLWGVIGLAITALLLCFSSCKVIKEVPVEVVKEKMEYKDRLLRDSIYLKDSVIVYQKGDTTVIYKDRFMYRDRYLHDTICRVDSIPYPVTVREKEVLSWYDSLSLNLGRWVIPIIALLVIGFLRGTK